MNTDDLVRATFVLDRPTSDRLSAISRRMGVSRSSLVREFLGQPVSMIADWVATLPDKPTEADVDELTTRVRGDISQLMLELPEDWRP